MKFFGSNAGNFRVRRLQFNENLDFQTNWDTDIGVYRES